MNCFFVVCEDWWAHGNRRAPPDPHTSGRLGQNHTGNKLKIWNRKNNILILKWKFEFLLSILWTQKHYICLLIFFSLKNVFIRFLFFVFLLKKVRLFYGLDDDVMEWSWILPTVKRFESYGVNLRYVGTHLFYF